MRKWNVLFLSAALVALMVPAAAPAAVYVYSGNITTGAQYDTYPILLQVGEAVVATLVCDEDPPPPGNRPLDPVLSVFRPGVDPSDTTNATFYDDDGYGSDDDPNGVDCNAFDSSRLRFGDTQAGVFTFRADGFGSATGPYTLRILTGVDALPYLEIPTLDGIGLALLAALLGGAALFFMRRRRVA